MDLIKKQYVVKWDSGRLGKYIGYDFQDAMIYSGFDYWVIKELGNYDIIEVNNLQPTDINHKGLQNTI